MLIRTTICSQERNCTVPNFDLLELRGRSEDPPAARFVGFGYDMSKTVNDRQDKIVRLSAEGADEQELKLVAAGKLRLKHRSHLKAQHAPAPDSTRANSR
jgi:hypothetical protein